MLSNKFLSNDGMVHVTGNLGSRGSLGRRRERSTADQFLGYGWMKKEEAPLEMARIARWETISSVAPRSHSYRSVEEGLER